MQYILLSHSGWPLAAVSGKKSYHQISRSLKATRLDVIMIVSLSDAAKVPVKF